MLTKSRVTHLTTQKFEIFKKNFPSRFSHPPLKFHIRTFKYNVPVIVTAVYTGRIFEQVQRRHRAADREGKGWPDRAFKKI